MDLYFHIVSRSLKTCPHSKSPQDGPNLFKKNYLPQMQEIMSEIGCYSLAIALWLQSALGSAQWWKYFAQTLVNSTFKMWQCLTEGRHKGTKLYFFHSNGESCVNRPHRLHCMGNNQWWGQAKSEGGLSGERPLPGMDCVSSTQQHRLEINAKYKHYWSVDETRVLCL